MHIMFDATINHSHKFKSNNGRNTHDMKMILANTELVFDKTNNLKLSILEELRILIYSRYVSRSSF